MNLPSTACRSSYGTRSPIQASDSGITAPENAPATNRSSASESSVGITAQPKLASDASPIAMVTARSLPMRSPSGPCTIWNMP